jgi:hypothetical protein
VAFYVPLGSRGLYFRVGTFLIGIFGGWVYWRASRRRGLMTTPVPLAFDLPKADLIPLNH